MPEDINPRQLIIAIQENLGITKKEISERTGISYGTLNRYTRNAPNAGRPRRTSIHRLANLYRQSLKRYGTAQDRGGAAEVGQAGTQYPGIDYKRDLLDHPSVRAGGRPIDLASTGGLGGQHLGRVAPTPFSRFLEKVAFYAKEDVERFAASGYRDRERLTASGALIGDAYLALVHELSAGGFAEPATKPVADDADAPSPTPSPTPSTKGPSSKAPSSKAPGPETAQPATDEALPSSSDGSPDRHDPPGA